MNNWTIFKDRFVLGEERWRDIRRICVEITGDFISGQVLASILYWNLPGKSTEHESKLRSKKMIDGVETDILAKSHTQMFLELGINRWQYRKSLDLIKARGIITTHIKRFNGHGTTSSVFNKELFASQYFEAVQSYQTKVDEYKESLKKERESRASRLNSLPTLAYPAN